VLNIFPKSHILKYKYKEIQRNVNISTIDLVNAIPYDFHTKTLAQNVSVYMIKSTSLEMQQGEVNYTGTENSLLIFNIK
jgi:hypothetical protein